MLYQKSLSSLRDAVLCIINPCSMKKTAVLLLLLGLTLADNNRRNGIVYFEPDGKINFSGTMEFNFDDDDGTVVVKVEGLTSTVDYTVRIHQYLADFSKVDRCDSDYIGGAYPGTRPPAQFTDSLLTMSEQVDNIGYSWTNTNDNDDEVVGRSVGLYSGSTLITCFPILPTGDDAEFLRSKVMDRYGISGEVTFILAAQEGTPNERYKLFSNIRLRDNDLSQRINAVLVNTADVTDQVQYGCPGAAINEIFVVDYANGGTSGDVNDYSAILSTGSILGPSADLPTAIQIKRAQNNVVSWASHESSCVPVYKMNSKLAIAKFFQNGLEFDVTFSQDSPFHPVKITKDAGFPDSLTISSLVVSDYTVPRYESQYHSASHSCALLWAKSSTTVNTAALNSGEYATNEITMFGPNSVTGKALLFKVGKTSFCADLKSDFEMDRYIADFHGTLGGNLILEQEEDGKWEDVTIYNSLYSLPGTVNQNLASLYINLYPAQELNTGTGRCPALSIQNKISTSLSKCAKVDYYYNCYEGATENRIGRLEIQNIDSGDVVFTRVYHDPYLWLVDDMSRFLYLEHLGLTSDTQEALDCANLKKMTDMSAVADVLDTNAVDAESLMDASGSVEMRYDVRKNRMYVDVDFHRILGNTESLTMNDKRVLTNEDRYNPFLDCSDRALGEVLNNNNAAVDDDTHDHHDHDDHDDDLTGSRAPSGDLGATYDLLDGTSKTLDLVAETPYYSFLSPRYSPMYKSLRLTYQNHRREEEPYNCANFNPEETAAETSTELYALFDQEELEGEIVFKQLVTRDSSANPANSGSSDPTKEIFYPTNVEVDLVHTGHENWVTETHRIYITDYENCGVIPDGVIKPREDLYNPYKVPFQTMKNAEFPHFAVVGDVTAKTDDYVSVGKRQFINVANLPLSGTFSIKGKALIVSDSIGYNYIGCTVITDERPASSGASVAASLALLLSLVIYNLW